MKHPSKRMISATILVFLGAVMTGVVSDSVGLSGLAGGEVLRVLLVVLALSAASWIGGLRWSPRIAKWALLSIGVIALIVAGVIAAVPTAAGEPGLFGVSVAVDAFLGGFLIIVGAALTWWRLSSRSG